MRERERGGGEEEAYIVTTKVLLSFYIDLISVYSKGGLGPQSDLSLAVLWGSECACEGPKVNPRLSA